MQLLPVAPWLVSGQNSLPSLRLFSRPREIDFDPLRRRVAGAPKSKSRFPSSIDKITSQLLAHPERLAEVMVKLPEEQRRSVALAWALTELEEEFSKADVDKNGELSYAEFRKWVMKVIETGPAKNTIEEPTRRQLKIAAFSAMVPFIGFGMVDNGLMVIYGDVIDRTFGMWFGISMLASAALGNAISNGFGMLLHGTIQRLSDQLGLPDPHLTSSQRKLRSVNNWNQVGTICGVISGCLLGMLPLAFMNQAEKEEQRSHSKKHTEE